MDAESNHKVAYILPLSYGLALLKQLLPVPTHIFKKDNHYFEKFDSEEQDDWNVLKTDYAFRCELLETIRKRKVCIISNEKPILYGGVECNEELTLIIGPINIADIDVTYCKLYALKHNATNLVPFGCKVQKLASMLLLIYSTITGKHLYLTDFLKENMLDIDIIENTNRRIASIFSEYSLEMKTHTPSMFEESIKNSIKSGDLEGLKKALNSIYANMRGTLSHNSLRSAKNLAIVDITIATRAAIDAGLPVEELYTVSDAFIMEVEDCRYESDALALSHACALRCTQMVNKFLHDESSDKHNISLIVNRACQYIEHHINEKFNTEQMCERLKVSSSYLSKLFKNEKKMSIGAYVRRRKIDFAKLLLRTTDKSIAEISIILAFNSQSHLGKVFLEETGTTPSKYRNNVATHDLIL